MSIYIKKNKFLFILTILTSVISSLGYVFMAVLLQQKILLLRYFNSPILNYNISISNI